MHWNTLFNPNRAGVDYTKEIDLQSTRSSFAKDYDRILFSAPFRKLQNKTQVFPLTDDIFVHNRLTHSLETASVGRTLGREVGKRIAEKHQVDEVFNHFYQNELQHVVSAASLAHDIGNPAFGHAGEKAISEYFRERFAVQFPREATSLTDEMHAELNNFEGNANGFRILTHNFNNAGGGEYKLTYSTLAAMVKYPCLAAQGNNKRSGCISTKKYNAFLSEWSTWKKIAKGTGMIEIDGMPDIYARHPFVFLVEAADDICYLIIDLEDAHRLGLVSYEDTFERLLGLLKVSSMDLPANLEDVLGKISSPDQKIAYLRALVIHRSIMECVNVFMDNEEALLAGQLNQSLTGLFPEPMAAQWKSLEEFSFKHIYGNPSVVEREIAGYRILQGLLEEFIHAMLSTGNMRSRQLRSLIPFEFAPPEDAGTYERIRAVLDFVSAMTDREAMKCYRLLNGIEV